MIKELILQEVKTILSTCVSKNRASEYMKQKLTELEGEIDKSM